MPVPVPKGSAQPLQHRNKQRRRPAALQLGSSFHDTATAAGFPARGSFSGGSFTNTSSFSGGEFAGGSFSGQTSFPSALGVSASVGSFASSLSPHATAYFPPTRFSSVGSTIPVAQPLVQQHQPAAVFQSVGSIEQSSSSLFNTTANVQAPVTAASVADASATATPQIGSPIQPQLVIETTTIPVMQQSPGPSPTSASVALNRSQSFTAATASIESNLPLDPDSQAKTLARHLAAGSNSSASSGVYVYDTLRKLSAIASGARLASSTLTYIFQHFGTAKKRAPHIWQSVQIQAEVKRFKEHLKLNHAALLKPRLRNNAVLSPRMGGGVRLRTHSFEFGSSVPQSPSSQPPRRKMLVKSRAQPVLLTSQSTSPQLYARKLTGRSSSGLNTVGSLLMPTQEGDDGAGQDRGRDGVMNILRTTSPIGSPTSSPTGSPARIHLTLPKSRSINPAFTHAYPNSNKHALMDPSLRCNHNVTAGTGGSLANNRAMANARMLDFAKTPDTRNRTPSASPQAASKLSLSSKKRDTWTSAGTHPHHSSIPQALRPLKISLADNLFAQRIAQAAAARAISLSPRSASQRAREQHLCDKMIQLQHAHQKQNLQNNVSHMHQSPTKSSLRAGLRSPGRHGRLSDFYEVGATLGRGSFSRVVLVHHRSTGQSFACKIVMTDPLSRAELRALQSEIEVLHDLAHPNICNLVEVFAENAFRVSLVFELCAGGELFDAIIRRDHFSEPEARDIMRGLIRGVAYLHSNNVVHRDLKPENILISRANGDLRYVKIADFGFARKIDPSNPHQLTRIVGTPGYMSPEVLTPGIGYGLEVDVWALGVIAYILLCGYAPFQHEDDTALRAMIIQGVFKFEDDADADSCVWTTVSQAAKELISCALVVDRSKRYDVYDMWAHMWLGDTSTAGQELRMVPPNSRMASSVGSKGSAIWIQPQISPAREQMRRYEAKKRLRARMMVIRAVGRMSAMRKAAQEQSHDANDSLFDIDDDEIMLDESI